MVTSYVRTNLFSILFGAGVGVLLAALVPLMVDWAEGEYDKTHPVWRDTVAEVVERQGRHLIVEIEGTKVRECRFVRVWAQVSYPNGARHDALVERPDHSPLAVTRPLGPQELGSFRIAPVRPDAAEVTIRCEHYCGDRLLTGVMATVPLIPKEP